MSKVPKMPNNDLNDPNDLNDLNGPNGPNGPNGFNGLNDPIGPNDPNDLNEPYVLTGTGLLFGILAIGICLSFGICYLEFPLTQLLSEWIRFFFG